MNDELNVSCDIFSIYKVIFYTNLESKGSTLVISKIQIDKGTAKYATGYVSLPFNWSNVGTERRTFPPNGKVTISFQSENLDLQKLFQDFGAAPPASGLLNLKLDAQGPLDQLAASLDLQMSNLRV